MLSFMAKGQTHPSSTIGMQKSPSVPTSDAKSKPVFGVRLQAASSTHLLTSGTTMMTAPASITSIPSKLRNGRRSAMAPPR
jgi:hypothetical protein